MTLVVILLCIAAAGWRLFIIAVAHHDRYDRIAQAQQAGATNVLSRGNIYVSAGAADPVLVATNRPFGVVLVAPRSVPPGRLDEVVSGIAEITGIAPEQVRDIATTDSSGTRTIARRLTDEQVIRIRERNLPGISLSTEIDRTYPAGSLAADAIGYFGYDESGRRGQYGVEESYDDMLSGRTAPPSVARWDIARSLRRLIGAESADIEAAEDRPQDIVLTLDRNVQVYAEKVLSDVLTRYRAASGVLIVQDPSTGRILAMADSPSFDPNRYSSFPISNFMNGALQSFEPGSSFKPFTMAMGLEDDRITPTTVFNDDGDVIVDGYTIKNFNEQHFGRVTMTEVLEKSINTGVMWVQELIGNDEFLGHAVDMGFGQSTGVDLPGESAGNLDNLRTKRRINFMTASFGQGITATPLQLVTAFSAIANGGRLMRPYIVDAVVDGDGHRTATVPELAGTPFSARTAAELRLMLTSVVDRGFDKARIARYDVAGKTGTAQIASPDGGYLEGQYNHTFVGFAPTPDPKFTIFIRMERPQGVTFAADSLSPAFREMSLFMLNYLNIPPTRP
jgi:cell division protein FtsI/penicillin-binding protein 2